MAYVYRHIRLDKNEPFYIGIGKSEDYKRAFTSNHRNKIWTLIKNKTDIEVEILFDNISWEEACNKEKEFILLYGRKDLNTGTLANLTIGGDGKVGSIISKETREKLSLASKGKKRPKELMEKIRLKNLGKKRSEEAKKNISEAHKGIRVFGIVKSEETRRKLSIANKNKIRGPRSEETKRKIGAANKLKKHNPIPEEQKIRQSESMKLFWAKKKGLL